MGVSIARRNLISEKARLLISVGGVAFSVLLVIILWGLYQGFDRSVTAYTDSLRADIWVGQEGSGDIFHSRSILPDSVGKKLRDMPGVAAVHRHVGRLVKVEIGDSEAMLFVVGFDAEEGIGGPVGMVEGASEPRGGEIIIDKVFARSNNLSIGDTIDILGNEFKVRGISEGGNMMVFQYAFVTLQEVDKTLDMNGLANYYAVRLKDPASGEQMMTRIENSIPGVQASSNDEFKGANRKMIDDSFLPIILVLVFIGFGVGVTVIGLTIYTATIEKSREYGVLKALGADNWQLYRIVFEQSLLSALLGYLVGIGLSLPIIWAAENLAPSFVTYLSMIDFLGVLALSLLMSLVASYIPVRRLVNIDPAIVFRQ